MKSSDRRHAPAIWQPTEFLVAGCVFDIRPAENVLSSGTITPSRIWRISMRTMRTLFACLILLATALPAVALVPRAVFVEMGSATW